MIANDQAQLNSTPLQFALEMIVLLLKWFWKLKSGTSVPTTGSLIDTLMPSDLSSTRSTSALIAEVCSAF